jgi:hypothetical protein
MERLTRRKFLSVSSGVAAGALATPVGTGLGGGLVSLLEDAKTDPSFKNGEVPVKPYTLIASVAGGSAAFIATASVVEKVIYEKIAR